MKEPLAVVIARPGGGVKDERSLLGGTRIDQVSRAAREHGVRRRETIAAARAKCASLRVRVVKEEAVRGVLRSVAEASLSFGRTASIDEARDVVCVDVTGCGHLFGGEAGLVRALGERIEEMRVGPARVVVADGPRVALALARAASANGVVAEGGNAEVICALPVSAMPIDAGSIAWLRKLGIYRVGDLQRLPARGLATRLGAVHAEVASLLAGDDGAPLTPYVPPEVPEERAELEYGVEQTEALLFVVKTLCDRLAARLAGRAMAAARVEIVVSLDRAIAREQQLEPVATLVLTPPMPLSTAAELFPVARARVESWTVPAPVLAVALRATVLARREGRALDLFEPEAKAERALPKLVAELAADLGVERVGTLRLADTWVAEERSVLVPWTTEPTPRLPPLQGGGGKGGAQPSRMFAVPFFADDVQPLRLLARIEAVAWWRLGARSCDFVAGWSAREGGMAWVEVDRATGQARVRGWMD